MSELATQSAAWPQAMAWGVAEKLSTALTIPADDLTQRRMAETLSRIPKQFSAAIQIRLVAGMHREDCAEAIGVSPVAFDVVLSQATRVFAKEWNRS